MHHFGVDKVQDDFLAYWHWGWWWWYDPDQVSCGLKKGVYQSRRAKGWWEGVEKRVFKEEKIIGWQLHHRHHHMISRMEERSLQQRSRHTWSLWWWNDLYVFHLQMFQLHMHINRHFENDRQPCLRPDTSLSLSPSLLPFFSIQRHITCTRIMISMKTLPTPSVTVPNINKVPLLQPIQ